MPLPANPPRSRPGPSSLAYCVAAALVFGLFCMLVPQLLSRYHARQASAALAGDEPGQARVELDAAAGTAGPWVPAVDRVRLDTLEGDLSIRLAETAGSVSAFVAEMQRAEAHFGAVVAAAPLDLDGYTGLARATAALEKVYPFVHRRPYGTQALPSFNRLLALMPVNLYSHSLITRYYHWRGMGPELQAAVSRSISLYPPLYYQLKGQPFYSMSMNGMLKKALQASIDGGIYVEQAWRVLSAIALEEGDYRAAVDHFLKTRTVRPYVDDSRWDLELGGLYLKAGLFAEAQVSFGAALRTPDREQRLNDIWALYKRNGALAQFLMFSKKVTVKQLENLLGILRARCLIEMDRLELADSYLLRVDDGKYAAEGLFLQARIAEKRKDWDTMELRSQRATVLDPGNSAYHMLFSRALGNQKKWPQAEKAAGDAIDSSEQPGSGMYNHRAWMRWNKGDLEGARHDWERAIGISPDNGSFYYGMALVFERGGNIEAALRYIDKALALKPGDAGFLKKREGLRKKQIQGEHS